MVTAMNVGMLLCLSVRKEWLKQVPKGPNPNLPSYKLIVRIEWNCEPKCLRTVYFFFSQSGSDKLDKKPVGNISIKQDNRTNEGCVTWNFPRLSCRPAARRLHFTIVQFWALYLSMITDPMLWMSKLWRESLAEEDYSMKTNRERQVRKTRWGRQAK